MLKLVTLFTALSVASTLPLGAPHLESQSPSQLNFEPDFEHHEIDFNHNDKNHDDNHDERPWGPPSVEVAAQQVRNLVHINNICTLNTEDEDGVPVGQMEYYADCSDPNADGDLSSSGDLSLIKLDISSAYRNIARGSKSSVSIRFGDLSPGGRVPWSPSAHPRVTLYGEFVDVTENVEQLEKCFAESHPDAVTWFPGNNSPHSGSWVRFQVQKIYYIGGFGDVAYIGEIPVDLYRNATVAAGRGHGRGPEHRPEHRPEHGPEHRPWDFIKHLIKSEDREDEREEFEDDREFHMPPPPPGRSHGRPHGRPHDKPHERHHGESFDEFFDEFSDDSFDHDAHRGPHGGSHDDKNEFDAPPPPPPPQHGRGRPFHEPHEDRERHHPQEDDMDFPPSHEMMEQDRENFPPHPQGPPPPHRPHEFPEEFNSHGDGKSRGKGHGRTKHRGRGNGRGKHGLRPHCSENSDSHPTLKHIPESNDKASPKHSNNNHADREKPLPVRIGGLKTDEDAIHAPQSSRMPFIFNLIGGIFQ